MWILIVGAPGTKKNIVGRHLEETQGFEFTEPMSLAGSPFTRQIEAILSRYNNQTKLQKLKDARSAVVGSFWESHFVYSKVMQKLDILSTSEYGLVCRLYEALSPYVRSPDRVIYLKDSLINCSANRDKSEFGEEFSNEIYREYANFVATIRVPVVEIDMSESQRQALKEVEDSVEFMGQTGQVQTIWDDGFMKGVVNDTSHLN